MPGAFDQKASKQCFSTVNILSLCVSFCQC